MNQTSVRKKDSEEMVVGEGLRGGKVGMGGEGEVRLTREENEQERGGGVW